MGPWSYQVYFFPLPWFPPPVVIFPVFFFALLHRLTLTIHVHQLSLYLYACTYTTHSTITLVTTYPLFKGGGLDQHRRDLGHN